MQHAKTTTDATHQEFLLNTVTNATMGAKVVKSLDAIGQNDLAKIFHAIINDKLDAIREIAAFDEHSAPTSAQRAQENLAKRKQLMDMTDLMVMRGEGDECLRIAGPGSIELGKIYLGAARGVGKGLVALADPRRQVEAAVQAAHLGCFVVKQLARLEAYQLEKLCGNHQLAAQYLAEFNEENAKIAQSAANFYNNFIQLPAESRAEAIAQMATMFAAGKTVTGLQMKALGIGLDGLAKSASTVAGKVKDVLAKAPEIIAITPEGLQIPVKAANELEGIEAAEFAARDAAMLEEAEGIKAGAEKICYKNINDGLNFGASAADHMADPARYVPIEILRDVIKTTKGSPDPRGAADALVYYSPFFKDGKMYNLKVVYNTVTNTIYHFHFTVDALGFLPKIQR
jgi:hypothetical protein